MDQLGTRRSLLCTVADRTRARRRRERRLLMGLRAHRRHQSMTQEKENAELIRRAYQAYASGDLAAMLELVDPGLE